MGAIDGSCWKTRFLTPFLTPFSSRKPENGYFCRQYRHPTEMAEVDPILWTKNGPSLAIPLPAFLTGNNAVPLASATRLRYRSAAG